MTLPRLEVLLIALALAVPASAKDDSHGRAEQESPPAAQAAVPQGAPQVPTPFPASKIHEQLVGEAPAGSEIVDVNSTQDHIAWVEKSGNEKRVRLDGKQVGGEYDDVRFLRFSGDRQHLRFLAKVKSNWFLAVDGEKRSREYGKMSAPFLSANGESFAVGACQEKRCRLVANGEETGPEYEDISAPYFTGKGGRYVYFGKRNKKWVAVLDGKEYGPEMDGYLDYAFIRDGERFAVAALMGGKFMWVVDGMPGPGFDVISPLAFNADATHYAYGGGGAKFGAAKEKTGGAIVEDGKIIQTYVGSGFFGGGLALMLGADIEISRGLRNLSADFHGVSDPDYTADGLVYAGRRDKGDVAVFLKGEAGPSFDNVVSSIVASRDGKHIAYFGKRGDSLIEVRDQKAGTSFPLESAALNEVSFIRLSNDGSHLAYETVRGGAGFKQGQTTRARRRIVLDGEAGPEYDALGIANFNNGDDWRHWYYIVVGAQGNRDRVVFDGLEGKLYGTVLNGTVRFVDEQTIEFVAVEGRSLFRVMETLN